MPGDKSDTKEWELVETKRDREYGFFSVSIHKSRSPLTGRVHDFQVIEMPDWVVVIAITTAGEMVLTRQFRHGSAAFSLEPPGGLVKKGHHPEQSAKEELEEETGYQADKFNLLGSLYPVPAIFKNKMFVYEAQGAVPTGTLNPDETEEIETVLMPLNRVRELIASGEIDCGVMVAALHLFFSKYDG
jgi:ADP-ribose pyrophosphatase